MKRTSYILTFLLFNLTNCSTDSKSVNSKTITNVKRDNSESNFENYLKTLHKIHLPFKHNALGQLLPLSKNYDKKAFEKYKRRGTTQPLGILFSDKKIVALIDCSIGDWGLVPFVTTYDRKGNKIDSLSPYNVSGEYMGYKAIEYLTINKDRTILVIDSVTTYSLTADSSDIDETSKKLKVGLTKYIIDKNGRIKKHM